MLSHKKINTNSSALIIISIISLINILLYRFVKFEIINLSLSYWLFFYVWVVSLLSALAFAWRALDTKFKNNIKKVLIEDRRELIIIISIAALFYFLFLESLDFVFVGDSLREAGYNALAIFRQDDFDPFALGSYAGYGNLVPTIGGVFISLLGTSATAVRLPTALMAILTIIILYLFLRLWQNKKIAIFASLLLIFSLRYLHYARSEIVIISPGLFILIFLFITYLIEKNKKAWLLLGLMIGLSFHFYVATRPIALLIVLYLFSKQFFGNKSQKNKIIKNFSNLFLGIIIGLGPSLNQLSHQATGAGNWLFQKNYFIELDLIDKSTLIFNQYMAALANNFFSKTSPIHYPQTTPILEFPLNFLTILGIYFILKKKEKFFISKLIIIFLFTLPLFLQVFSSDISQDQRNVSNLVLSTIISAIALEKLFSKNSKFAFLNLFVILLLVLNFFSTTRAYFFEKISYKNFINDQDDFSLQAVCNHIYQYKNNYRFNKTELIVVYDRPELLHIQEKLTYCAFPVSINLIHYNEFQSNPKYLKSISYFVNDYALNLAQAQQFKTICTSSLWPNYACPLENYDYSFFLLKN